MSQRFAISEPLRFKLCGSVFWFKTRFGPRRDAVHSASRVFDEGIRGGRDRDVYMRAVEGYRVIRNVRVIHRIFV